MHRRMHADARLDPLTGAGSRSRLDEDLRGAVRAGRALRARVLRGDGRARAGERRRAARAPAARSVREIRSGDAVYRSGPKTFVVLLPEQALDTANLAAARLRRAVENAVAAGHRGQRRDRHDRGRRAGAGGAARAGRGGPRALGARPAASRTPQSANAGPALRLIVADDDPVSRLMLGAIVKREPGFELVGEAADASQAVELALRRRPDVVLLDVDMPGGGGARAAVEIREGLPEVRIVAISADDSQGTQYDMMRAGAVGLHHQGLAGRRDPARDPLSSAGALVGRSGWAAGMSPIRPRRRAGSRR